MFVCKYLLTAVCDRQNYRLKPLSIWVSYFLRTQAVFLWNLFIDNSVNKSTRVFSFNTTEVEDVVFFFFSVCHHFDVVANFWMFVHADADIVAHTHRHTHTYKGFVLLFKWKKEKNLFILMPRSSHATRHCTVFTAVRRCHNTCGRNRLSCRRGKEHH